MITGDNMDLEPIYWGLSQSICGEPLFTHQYTGTIEGFENRSFDHIIPALVGSKGFNMFTREYTHNYDHMTHLWYLS